MVRKACLPMVNTADVLNKNTASNRKYAFSWHCKFTHSLERGNLKDISTSCHHRFSEMNIWHNESFDTKEGNMYQGIPSLSHGTPGA